MAVSNYSFKSIEDALRCILNIGEFIPTFELSVSQGVVSIAGVNECCHPSRLAIAKCQTSGNRRLHFKLQASGR